MDFEGALRARLLAAAPVTALLANYTPPGGVQTKAIFWVERPQKSSLPAITLQIIDEERKQHMDGFDARQFATVQIDVWALTYGSGKAIKEAVIAALAPETISNGVKFGRAFVRTRDLSENTATQFIFRPSMDFDFNYAAQ